MAARKSTATPHSCECGCGEPTRVIAETNRTRGRIAGQPYRFVHGHRTRLPRRQKPLAERLWSKVDVRGPDECWPFLGAFSGNGYGGIRADGRWRSAHAVAYELATGKKIPPGMEACHSCDVRYQIGSIEYRRCCNPAHVWPGTPKENGQDKVLKGRQAKGDRQGLRLHPERRAWGDRNGSRLHPERLARGERHGRSKHS